MSSHSFSEKQQSQEHWSTPSYRPETFSRHLPFLVSTYFGAPFFSAMSGIVSTIEGLANTVTTKAMAIVDSVFPPERRQELLTKLQQFAIKNPKLSVC